MSQHIVATIKTLETLIEKKEREIDALRVCIKLFEDEVPKPDPKPIPKPQVRKKRGCYKKTGKKRTLPKGIYTAKGGKKGFRSCYYSNGKNKQVGVYPTVEQAVAAREDYINNLSKNISKNKTAKKEYEHYWECAHCHLEYRTEPTVCPRCQATNFIEGRRPI